MLNQKNIVIACLALLCVLFLVAWQAERSSVNNRPLSATEYGCLLSMREVLPPEQFKAEVLPLLQSAAAGKPVTFGQLEALNGRLGDISKHVLALAEKKSPQEELAKAWEDTKQNATQLSEQFGREMNNMLNELSDMLPGKGKESPQAPSQPAPVSPSSPQGDMTPIEL